MDFIGGSSKTFGSSYFTLAPDGLSLDGSAIPIGGTNPLPTDATLQGVFSPLTIGLTGGGTDTINSSFTAEVLPKIGSSSLQDGDLVVIDASSIGTSAVPEPSSLALVASLIALALLWKVSWVSVCRAHLSIGRIRAVTKQALPVLCLIVIGQSAFGQVTLSTVTSPSSGVAGVNNVNLTGGPFPSGTITPSNINVSFATSCGGPAVATANATSLINILGSTDRVNVVIPAGLSTRNYFLTIADSVTGDPNFTTNAGSCAELSVTGSTAILNACVAGSSLGVLLPAGGAGGNVTAYVPKGYWLGSATGIFVKNIEGSLGGSTTVPTPHVVNSCSSNPATGKTVCVANNTDVYVISGTTLSSSLTSGSNSTTSFSGGSCENCGVALNANNNTAVINMGLTGGASNSGVQILDLNTNTFEPAFPMGIEVSENISVDPTRSLILSASENGNFTLDQIQSNGSLKEFNSSFSIGSESDSSAEDCSTGVGLSPQEETNNLTLVNLNDITFATSTYTAPHALVTLSTPGYGGFSSGLSGSAVAQGSGHLAVVTGEFGGNKFAVLKLPPTPGTATPALVDYAVSAIPSNAACGGTFSAGYDPHTITAYTSPNTGHSYAVFAGYSGGVPICLAVVDMTIVIDPTLSPRGGAGFGANEVSPANLPASAVTFFAL